MMNWLVSLLSAPVLNALLEGWKAKLASTDTRDQMAVDLAAKQFSAEIEARKSADAIVIAEQGHWYTAMIRPMLALPVIIYVWKVIVWDKVLGLGSTDPITGLVAEWAGAIVVTYVGGLSLEKIASRVTTIVAGRR